MGVVDGDNFDGGDVTRNFQTAAGLFSYLEQGQCVGYRQTMLEELTQNSGSNKLFEAVRIMGVLAILLGMTMVFWTLFMTTLSMRRWELWAQRCAFFALSLLVGLSLPLMLESSLCSEDAGDRSDVSCSLDQGGLVAIAATILWFVGLLISSVFVRMPGSGDLILIDGELRSEFEERQNNRKRQIAFQAVQRERKEEARARARQQRDLERQAEDERAKDRSARQPLTAAAEESLSDHGGGGGGSSAAALPAAAIAASAVAAAAIVAAESPEEEEPDAMDNDDFLHVEPDAEMSVDKEQDMDVDMYLTRTLDNIVSICGPNDEVEI